MAAPRVTEENVEFTSMKGIVFKEITTNARVQLSNMPLPEGKKDKANLFVVSNLHGCFVAATDTGFVVDYTAKLRQEFRDATDGKPHKLEAAINVTISNSRVRIIRLSADEKNVLIVTTACEVVLYNLETLFANPNVTKPARSFNFDMEILDIQPNPSLERNDVAAVLMADQTIQIVSLESQTICSIADEKFTAMGWSSKGKQIMCGTSTGTMFQYTPEGQKKKEHLPPSGNKGDRVVAIKWLETAVILAVYCRPEEGDAPLHQYQVCIMSKEDKTMHTFYNFGDLNYPMFQDIRSYTYIVTQAIKNWSDDVNEVMVVSSAASPDLGIIGRTKTSTWQCWDLEDNARAAVPTSALNSEEVYCVGLTFDLTSQEKLPPLEEDDPEVEPVPVLYVYDNEGFVSAFQLINVGAAKAGIKCPVMVNAQPFTLHTPAAKPATKTAAKVVAGSALPSIAASASKTTPTSFGAAASPFVAPGAAAAKGFGFGETSSATQSPQLSLGSQSSLTSFGQASFGQTAFGNQPAAINKSAANAVSSSPDMSLAPKSIPPAKFKGTIPSVAIAAAKQADEKVKITRKKSEAAITSEHRLREDEHSKVNVSPGMAALSQQLENTYVVMKRELAALASLVGETNALIKSRESLFEELPLVKTQIETHARTSNKIKDLNKEVEGGFVRVHAELVKAIHKKDEILRLLKDRLDNKASTTEDDERGLTPAQTAGLQRMANSLETIEKRLKDVEDYVDGLQRKASRIRDGLTARPPALESIHSSIRNISYALLSKQNDLAQLVEELDRLSINTIRLPGEPSKLLSDSTTKAALSRDNNKDQAKSLRTSFNISSQAFGVSTVLERSSLSRQLRHAAFEGQHKVLLNNQVLQQGSSFKDLVASPNVPDVGPLATSPRRSDQPKKRMTAMVPSMATAATADSPSVVAPIPSAATSGFGFGLPTVASATPSFTKPADVASTPSPFNLSAKPAVASSFIAPTSGFGSMLASSAKPMFSGFGTPTVTSTFGAASMATMTSSTSTTPSLFNASSTAAVHPPASSSLGGISFAKPQATVAPQSAATLPLPASKPSFPSLFNSSTISTSATTSGVPPTSDLPKPPTFPGFSIPTKGPAEREEEEEEGDQKVFEGHGEEEEEEEEVYDSEGEEEEYDEEAEDDYDEHEEYDEEYDNEPEYDAYLEPQDSETHAEEGGDGESAEEQDEEGGELKVQSKPTGTAAPIKSAFGTSSWAAPSYSFPVTSGAVGSSSTNATATGTTSKSAFPSVSAPATSQPLLGSTASFGMVSAFSSGASTNSLSTATAPNTGSGGFPSFGVDVTKKEVTSPFTTFGAGKNIFEDFLKKSDESQQEKKDRDEVESKASQDTVALKSKESSESGGDEQEKNKDNDGRASITFGGEERKSQPTITKRGEEQEVDDSLATAANVEEGQGSGAKQIKSKEIIDSEDEEQESEKGTTISTSSAATVKPRPALNKELSTNSEESFNMVEKPSEDKEEGEQSDQEKPDELEEEEEEEHILRTPSAAERTATAAPDSEEEEEVEDEEDDDTLSPVLTGKKPVPGISPADSESEDEDDVSSTTSDLLPPVGTTSGTAQRTGELGGFGNLGLGSTHAPSTTPTTPAGADEKEETASLFSSWGGISGSSSTFGSTTASTPKASVAWGFGSTTTSTLGSAPAVTSSIPAASSAWGSSSGGFGSSTITSAPITTTSTTSATTSATPAFGQKSAWGSNTTAFGQSSFGQSSSSGFDSSSTTTSTPATSGTGSSAFGQVSSSTSGFGLPAGFGQPSTFGASSTTTSLATPTTSTGGSGFGQTSTLGSSGTGFGQTSTLGGGGVGGFGQTSTLGSSGGNAFGQTSTLGSTGGNAFGQTSTLGGGFGQTAFGQTSTLGSGFGQTSTLGSGFGSKPFGSSTTSSSTAPQSNFGSFASGSNAFASLAQQGASSSIFEQSGGGGGWGNDTSTNNVFGGGGGGSSAFGGGSSGPSAFGSSGSNNTAFGGFGGQQQQQQQQQSAFGGGSNATWGSTANNNNTTWGASSNKPNQNKSAFTQFR